STPHRGHQVSIYQQKGSVVFLFENPTAIKILVSISLPVGTNEPIDKNAEPHRTSSNYEAKV
ncbi:MAG: hypothetical protein MK234_09240, partial [Nitrospinales bacterium]|nr:hypothetical protein [Nitrospinales bacterium]